MSTFNKNVVIPASASQIQAMADSINQEFSEDGYEVKVDSLIGGGCDISITKGGSFKAVLGMRSALKVTMTPTMNGVLFDAHVGIFGQQALPTVISMFFFWPVLITQIWGLVKQSKLDDRALLAARRAVGYSTTNDTPQATTGQYMFCTKCGTQVPADSVFCPKCGNKF